MQNLPIGIQTFRKIREDDNLYVDKTKQIHNLITTNKVYFLSRPRRFGKSLLISTLEEIFKGNKDLFEDLAIAKTDYDWQEYPVIRIDFSTIPKDNREMLEQGLQRELERIAENYNLKIQEKLTTDYFKSLIQELKKNSKTK